MDSTPRRQMRLVREFMHESLDKPLTLETLADVAGYSPWHFRKLFLEAFEQTPHEWMSQRRFERAKHLLRKTDYSVFDVCLLCGYQSLGSFTNAFNERAGMPPAQFRRTFACPELWLLKSMPGCFRSPVWT